jgi:hypothetical protein
MCLNKLEVCLIVIISLIIFSFCPNTQERAQAWPQAFTQVKAQMGAQSLNARQASALAAKTSNADPKVIELALKAHKEAQAKGLVKKQILTVIDYSKRSVEKRLWVFDLNTNKLLMETHVTHGEKTGNDIASRFSNIDGSHQSSIGVFTTAETYHGQHGYSLRIDGHEPGFNDKARKRAIVVHGASYASESYAKRMGRLGRSWGCPAVDYKLSRKLIDTIKHGSMIFAYYPHNNWMKSSSFLKN